MNIRPGNVDDLPFLEQMLFEAFFWNPSTPRFPMDDFLANPQFQKYLLDWGRLGDKAVIAEEGGQPIGAAWYRFWTEKDQTYGFVNAETPELGMAVHANHRSKGVGRALLRVLIAAARDSGAELEC